MIKYRGCQYRALKREAVPVSFSYEELLREFVQHERYAEAVAALDGAAVDLILQDNNELEEDDLDWYEVQEVAEQLAAERLAEKYNAVKEEQLDGVACYRAVVLDPGTNPRRLDPLGVYWSLARSGAWAYDGPGGKATVFTARVAQEHVAVKTTVLHNALFPDDEAEVTMIPGRPIWVGAVELEDGTVIEINDWRTT